MLFRCIFLVVIKGKPLVKSNRICRPKTERVPTPVRSSLSTRSPKRLLTDPNTAASVHPFLNCPDDMFQHALVNKLAPADQNPGRNAVQLIIGGNLPDNFCLKLRHRRLSLPVRPQVPPSVRRRKRSRRRFRASAWRRRS